MPVPLKTIAEFRVPAPEESFPVSHSQILALDNGQFDIGWSQDLTSVAFWDTDVRLQRFNADSSSMTRGRSASPTGSGDNAESDVSMATLGTFQVVAYTDRGSPGTPGSIRLDFYSADQIKAGGGFVTKTVALTTGGSAVHPEVAALADGKLAVAYYDEVAHSVKARVYDPVTDSFKGGAVTVSATATSAVAVDLGLTALSIGGFAVTWTDEAGTSHMRLISNAGAADSADFSLAGSSGATVVEELANGDLATAVIAGGHVRLQIFDLDGGVGPVRLQSATLSPAATETDLSMTALEDGRLLIVFARGGKIIGTITDADGSVDTRDFVVASGAGALSHPDVETLADGRVVVSYDKAGSDAGVFATVLDPREHGVNLAGTGGADSFFGSRFDDTINTGAAGDWISAGAGDDRIDGGAGADTMIGGVGSDLYFVNSDKDVVVEYAGEGNDTMYSTVSVGLQRNVENLILLGSAIKGTGNTLANSMTGNAANNVLDGLEGADLMAGKAGNDTYYVDHVGDVVVEQAGGGTDIVMSSITYQLAANVENIVLTGTAAINARGNELNNSLTGNGAANVLSGGDGNDILIGGGGNDTYFAADSSDRIVEAAGGGNDTVTVLSDYVLTAGAQVEKVQSVYVGNRVAINLTGNEFSQEIIGTAGSNMLDGKGGADILSGFAGNDTFAFTTALGKGNVDQITDFSKTAGSFDRIALDDAVFLGLKAGALAEAAFSSNAEGTAKDLGDRIVYETDTGKLFYDADGLGGVAGIHFATLTGQPAITVSDFWVI